MKIRNKFKYAVGQKLNVLTVKITGNQKGIEDQIIPVYITSYSSIYLRAII